MRRTFLTSILAAGLVSVSFVPDASAQAASGFVLPASTHVVSAPLAALSAPVITQRTEARPRILPALYAGSVLFQALDVQLTLKALSHGAVEANPIMRAVVKRPMAFIAIKAAGAALAVHAAERLWRSGRRKTAIALMAINTGMMAIVGIHNASVVRGLR